MNPRLLMIASGLFLGVTSLLASFAPDEVLTYLGVSTAAPMPVLIQILGALYFAFAMLNWMAKDNILGGVYSRPVTVANLSHFVIGGLALAKFQTTGAGSRVTLVFLVIYAIFAVLFGGLAFGPGRASPKER